MKTIVYVIITVACACLTYIVGYHIGMRRAGYGISNPAGYEIAEQTSRFESLVNKVKTYIVAHNGEIPADLYRAMVESGVVDSYAEFMYIRDEVVHIPILTLPPLVNKNLSQNVRAPLFWLNMDRVAETWVCYLDGTWQRVKHGQQPEQVGVTARRVV